MKYIQENPLITIITITFNAVDTIENTIKSVLEQTYPNIEYIIIDGGSKDGTVDIIKKYSKKISYWISEPDEGIYNAMNKGINHAHGAWINFMNAGDTFFNKNTIENCNFKDLNNQVIKVIYGDTIIKRKGKSYTKKGLPIQKIHRCIIGCHQSIFVSTDNIQDIKFNESYKLASDYNTIYSLYKKYNKEAFHYIPSPISIYDAEFGISSKQILKTLKEQLLIRSKHKDFLWYYDFIKYIIKCGIHKYI